MLTPTVLWNKSQLFSLRSIYSLTFKALTWDTSEQSPIPLKLVTKRHDTRCCYTLIGFVMLWWKPTEDQHEMTNHHVNGRAAKTRPSVVKQTDLSRKPTTAASSRPEVSLLRLRCPTLRQEVHIWLTLLKSGCVFAKAPLFSLSPARLYII